MLLKNKIHRNANPRQSLSEDIVAVWLVQIISLDALAFTDIKQLKSLLGEGAGVGSVARLS